MVDLRDFGSGLDCVVQNHQKQFAMKIIWLMMLLVLTQCTTTVAVLDVAGSTVVYAGKTVVNTVDLLTPDIVNRK